ncbi:MAG TPA: ADP-glyceromanno-heptose 6-epimerase [Ideonella sp.]|nr:ADP-glyceromanno-heptose 6-epimerase [Ideonella sp.]HEX5683214.1 ADP-glyceromanno-heptose 6-epimerase [Ideonella sp.]
MRVVVTGAAGFIGSNLVHALNARGIDDVIAVDDLTNGQQFRNLVGTQLSSYVDMDEFYARFERGEFGRVDAVLHQGACSDTMVHDGKLMMARNYECSRRLLEACLAQGSRLIYASSAAVYGGSTVFAETPGNERPLNVYGWSKLVFDQTVRRALAAGAGSQIAGLRYFNVYGPREQHKGRMASVAFHHFGQFQCQGQVALFGDYNGYGPGAHERDFVWVGDVVDVNLWLLENGGASGVFNVGSGRAEPFNAVAASMLNSCRGARGDEPLALSKLVDAGQLRYTPFPDALRGHYQCHTQADLRALRKAGYTRPMTNVSTGVALYAQWLMNPTDGLPTRSAVSQKASRLARRPA